MKLNPYSDLSPEELRDFLLASSSDDHEVVASALIILCGVVSRQSAEIERLSEESLKMARLLEKTQAQVNLLKLHTTHG